ncbi:MAG TPA: hypothetical protein PLM79_11985 [Syntrophobacteraceae bacterium]|nr:hypothetical protein [Syntrophobacteraceae bacterium]
MALDEPRDTDEVKTINEFTWVMEKSLQQQTGLVTVDFVNYGMGSSFLVTSEVPVNKSKAGCGTCCSH